MNNPRRKAINDVIKRLEALNEELQSIKKEGSQSSSLGKVIN